MVLEDDYLIFKTLLRFQVKDLEYSIILMMLIEGVSVHSDKTRSFLVKIKLFEF